MSLHVSLAIYLSALAIIAFWPVAEVESLPDVGEVVECQHYHGWRQLMCPTEQPSGANSCRKTGNNITHPSIGNSWSSIPADTNTCCCSWKAAAIGGTSPDAVSLGDPVELGVLIRFAHALDQARIASNFTEIPPPVGSGIR
jgi:hypothetical protein